MDEEEDQQKLLDLVKELIHCLLSQNLPPNFPPLNPNFLEFHNFFRYILRILYNYLTPSVASDVVTIVDSVKRCLATMTASPKLSSSTTSSPNLPTKPKASITNGPSSTSSKSSPKIITLPPLLPHRFCPTTLSPKHFEQRLEQRCPASLQGS
ncbi:hypothetical protein VNO78_02488 [Psophocarpus tetragonolobus]|uniref:Uncharacterized protein n=1 Tax=Psophocarpus tetragonolobus TaxID=3891 RepID=A0AAN9SYZ7_PSOTE